MKKCFKVGKRPTSRILYDCLKERTYVISDAANSQLTSTTKYAFNKYILLFLLVVLYYFPKQYQY